LIAPHVSNVELRLTDAREGKSGFSASDVPEGLAGPSGDEGKSGEDFFTPSAENRWGVFLTGIGDFAKTDSEDDYVGYNTTQSGFTLGADYRLTPNLILGALAGFAHEHAGFADGSSLSEDGAKLGFYGTAFTGGLYLNFAGIGGYDSFDSNRIDFFGTTAKGSGNAEEVAGFVGTGYDFTFGNFKIGPTSSFQYQRSFTQGWNETGGTLPLEFPGQSTGDITTKAGAKASVSFRSLGVQFTPELRAEWQHDFRGSIPVNFNVPLGPVVQDYSPHIGLNSLSLVAGSSVQLSETYTVYLYYNGDLLRVGYVENDVSGGVRCSF
jgi:outer membrane autotransporter protein